MDDRACGRFRRRASTRAAARILAATLALILPIPLIAGPTHAQERHNFLAVDGRILDDAGPYYFIAYGDSGNAFARARPFAEALGLTVHEDAAGTLSFRNGGREATFRISSDIAAGLQRSTGAVTVNGAPFPRPVPSAIRVNGVTYVPVTPLAEAFGAEARWFAEARVIEVDLPRGNGHRIAEPRIGRHDGFVRVAIDLPDGQETRVLVGDRTVALALPGADLARMDRNLDTGDLIRVHAGEVDGTPALLLTTDHQVDAGGNGWRFGRTEGGTAYLDVGRGLGGSNADGELPEARAPPPAPAPTAIAPEERRYVVVVDAGHGGHDPGTVSPWAREKDIVLTIAQQVAERLRNAGVQVVMTRDRDEFLSLQQRANFATTDQNLFISIHANAAANPAARGIETWVFGQPMDPRLVTQAIRENGGGDLGAARTAEAAESANIAGDILRETQLNYSLRLASGVQDRLIHATGAPNRGVRRNLFYVLRNSRIPAILIEVGFVSNRDEGQRLTQPGYQATLASAISDGVLEFLAAGGDVARQ